jgi:hypothetical protein
MPSIGQKAAWFTRARMKNAMQVASRRRRAEVMGKVALFATPKVELQLPWGPAEPNAEGLNNMAMNEGGGARRDAILFNLGILDLERALVERLAKSGRITGNSVAGRSDLPERKVRELAMQADLPDQPGVQTSVEYGTLSVIAQLCGVLIGQDVVDAESLIEAMKRKAEFWRSEGSVYRALPAEILHEALLVMAAEKKDVDFLIAASRSAIRSGGTQ